MVKIDVTYPGDTVVKSFTALVRQPVSPTTAQPIDIGLVEISTPYVPIPGPIGPPGPGVIISDTPPPNPKNGTQWWESDTGILWAWYVDADSAQWVQISGGTGSTDIRIRSTVSPYDFGGVGDGVADDRLAIQSAIDYLSTTFKSGTVDMSGGIWLVDSADIVVKSGVTLLGSWNNVGEVLGAAYKTLTSAIHLNPAYTINLSQDFSAIKGMVVLNKNLQTPSSVRQMIDNVRNFAGTAITIGVRTGASGAANDTYVGYCLVIGFQYAYWSDYNERVTIEYLRGDNTNGVRIARCYDMNHMSHCHMWGYIGSHLNFGASSWAVTGAANNGSGLIRLTVASNILTTGDVVTVKGVTGTVEANGRWIATVINATTIDLQGSTFTNAYAGPGTIYASAMYGVRAGIAYNFADDVDWGQADHCFSYGYDIGFNIEGGDHGELVNCGTDNASSLADPTTIGFRVKNSLATKLIGCKSAATAYGIWADLGTSGAPMLMVTGHDFWGLNNTGLYHVSGTTNLMSSVFFGTLIGVYVDPNSLGVRLIGNQNMGGLGTPISAPAGRGQRQSFVFGNGWADGSPMGNQMVYGNTQREWKFDTYEDIVGTTKQTWRKARGTTTAPTVPVINDVIMHQQAQMWDGVDTFRPCAEFSAVCQGTPSPTSMPGRWYFGAVAGGSTTMTQVMALQWNSVFPVVDNVTALGGSNLRWSTGGFGYITITDGIAQPGGFGPGSAAIYIDNVTGDLMVKFGDGVVKTIMVDT